MRTTGVFADNSGLQVTHNADPAPNLRLNGATEEEIRFPRGERDWKDQYRGHRVELNAFTSDQFIRWLETNFNNIEFGK